MRVLGGRIICTGLAAFACLAFFATPGMSDKGKDALYAAASPTVSQPSRPAPAIPIAVTGGVGRARTSEAEYAVSGAEPDPESFDQAGLEIWWAKYKKTHRGN